MPSPWRNHNRRVLPPLRAEDHDPEEFNLMHTMRSDWLRLPIKDFHAKYGDWDSTTITQAIGENNCLELIAYVKEEVGPDV